MCHGRSGNGEGWLAEHMIQRVPPLTQLKKSNGGVFPFERAYQVIDGRIEVRMHGPRAMRAIDILIEKGAAAVNHSSQVMLPFKILSMKPIATMFWAAAVLMPPFQIHHLVCCSAQLSKRLERRHRYGDNHLCRLSHVGLLLRADDSLRHIISDLASDLPRTGTPSPRHRSKG